jgi:hypothetical protein
MPKKLIENLNLGKVFLRPSQGIFGIRHAGRPQWSALARESVLPTFWESMKAVGVASFCRGKSGKEYFKCLQEQAGVKLPYAGVSGIWYAIALEPDEGKKYAILMNRFVTGWQRAYSDTAVMNAKRIVHAYIANAARDVDEAIRLYFVKPVQLTDKRYAKEANDKAGKPMTDDLIDKLINDTVERYKEQFADTFVAYATAIANSAHLPEQYRAKANTLKGESKEALIAKIEPYLTVR